MPVVRRHRPQVGRASATAAASGTPSSPSRPPTSPPAPRSLAPSSPPRPITQVPIVVADPIPTGVAELDRVLGGGLVPGSVTLVGGEPGIGKSTLLLQVTAHSPAAGTGRCTSPPRSRPSRCATGPSASTPPATSCTSRPRRRLPHLLGHVDACRPELIVVDSVQTVHDPSCPPPPARSPQVRAVTSRLVRAAKERDLIVVLVGHVTKDGGLAGPASSSTWSTPSSPSRATDTTCCDCCGRPSIGSVPPRSWACSPSARPASTRSPTRPACSSPTGGPASRARSWCPPSRGVARCWSSCRRWWRAARRCTRIAAARASRAAASGCCSRCSTDGWGCGCSIATCTRWPSAARRSSSRAPTCPRSGGGLVGRGPRRRRRRGGLR